MDGWSEDLRRWDEEWERANTCMFGCNCREQLNCVFLHSPEELQLFRDERVLRMRKLRMRCGFCAGGVSLRGFLCSFATLRRAERTSEDSGYESSGASAEGSGTDSAREDRALAGDGDGGEDDG